MSRKLPTRPAGKDDARAFLSKAEELVHAAVSDLEAGRHSASGLAAVHAAISAADAITAHRRGVTSTSSDHGAVVELLRQA